MMWLLALIPFAFLLYKFFTARAQMKSELAVSGGMKEHYALLVNYMRSFPDSKIVLLTEDMIRIAGRNKKASHHFTIQHSFNEVTIDWEQSSSTDSQQDQWKFPVTVDQAKALKTIQRSIDQHLGSYDTATSEMIAS